MPPDASSILGPPSAGPVPGAAPLRGDRLVTALDRGLREAGIGPGEPVAVAVSGGADSTALLLALRALADRRDPPARPRLAIHVHHQLRGIDADHDRDAAVALAAALGVPMSVRQVDPRPGRGNLLDRARRLRESALAAAAREAGCATVLTGHHADDQLESMLMALGRGGGRRGLAGMPPCRPLSGDGGIRLVRPLLAVPRHELERACRAAGVRWRDDPGNRDPARTRGRLRLEVLPVFERLWPGAAERAHAAARDLAAATSRRASVLDAALPGAGPWPVDLAARLAAADPDGVFDLLRRRLADAGRPAPRTRLAAATAQLAAGARAGSWPLDPDGTGASARLECRSGEVRLFGR